MENFQTLASESFSYNWLVNKSLPSSLVCVTSSSQDFDFKISFTTSAYTLVDASEIFYDGKIVASLDNHSNSMASSYPSTPINMYKHSSYALHDSPAYSKRFTILKRWRKSSRKILKKCFRTLLSDSSHDSAGESVYDSHVIKNTPFDADDSIYEAIVYCKRSLGTHLVM